MKVKDLIKLLSDFNPDADVMFRDYDDIEYALELYGWTDFTDDYYDNGQRNIEKEKLEATIVSFSNKLYFNNHDSKGTN